MANNSYDAGIQIERLGLLNILSGNRNKRILDIGCGEKGSLVRTLLTMGFEAEGLDRKAKDEEFLLKQNITNIFPWKGGVPREDSSYDLVTSHHNPILNEQYSCFGETYFSNNIKRRRSDEENREISINGRAILDESLRLMKPDGKIIVYPGIDTVEKKEHVLLNRYGARVVHEPIEVPLPEHRCLVRLIQFGYPIGPEDCSDSLNFRTIIHGSDSSPIIKGYLDN